MPATGKLLYRNRGLKGTWTASSEVATLPATNLASAIRKKVWRATGKTSEWVKVDLGAAQAIDAVALISSNLSAGATITIEANTIDDFVTPAFSTTLTPWAATLTNVMVKFLAATQTFRWWRIVLADAGNAAAFVEIGVVVLSPILAFADAPQLLRYQIVDPSPVVYSPGGTPFTWELDPYAVVELPYRFLAESLAFGDFQTAVRFAGRKLDLVLSLFPDGPSADDVSKATNLYGRLVELPPLEYQVPQKYDWPAVFRESL